MGSIEVLDELFAGQSRGFDLAVEQAGAQRLLTVVKDLNASAPVTRGSSGIEHDPLLLRTRGNRLGGGILPRIVAADE